MKFLVTVAVLGASEEWTVTWLDFAVVVLLLVFCCARSDADTWSDTEVSSPIAGAVKVHV
jgi:hypothetical protein